MVAAQTFEVNVSHQGTPSLFQDIVLSLTPGMLCHIQGPNGSGKTTLLKTIGYLLRTQHPACHLPNAWATQAPVFYYLPHIPPFVMHLTVAEALAIYGKLLRITDEKTEKNLADWRLAHKKEHMIYQLSQGERQRLSLCQMTLHQVPLWLLDEPFTSLDQHARTHLTKKIKTHLKQGGMICLASHEPLAFEARPHQTITLS